MAQKYDPWQHTQSPRGFEYVASSRSWEGRFGRMFRELPAAEFSEAQLEALARSMVLPAPEVALGEADLEHPNLAAGYTFFGQFITHDLTFDPSSLADRTNDPGAMSDYRTPRFDLDSLYGRGPDDQPYLYGDDGSLLTGLSCSKLRQFEGPDLPRNARGRAIIGDPRNDENKIISQFHALFIRFHNYVLANVADGDALAAQTLVRWHYQWLVVNDFLPLILPQRIIDTTLKAMSASSLNFYQPRFHAYLPVEFSAAAFRFGHALVRPSYALNDSVLGGRRVPLFVPGSGSPTDDLRSFGALPQNWGIQWGYFFKARNVRNLPQRSYRIGERLASPLTNLPAPVVVDKPPALALRNLERGVKLGLPSGQAVAFLLGQEPLRDEKLFEGDKTGLQVIFKGQAPLWYYILREAKLTSDGERLGPVGGTIVAETIMGLLLNDAQSYLRRHPTWQPSFGRTMGDLVREIGASI